MNRVGKLVNLFRGFEIAIVSERFVKLTFVSCVSATDLRTRFIDAAPVIVLQMLAGRMHQQIPIPALHENGGPIMQ